MSTPYLTVTTFTTRSTMPSGDVTFVETSQPGYIAARLAYWQDKIEARLRKRYAIPFATPVPEVVLGWLTDLVTPEVYRKRGVDPQDPQLVDTKNAAAAAWAEVLEAANSQTSQFDLPVRADVQTSAVVSGGPLSYAEQSPYTWARLQACDGRTEDENG